VTDFVNLNIKLTQSFKVVYMGRVCVRVFVGVSAHTYMSIRIYIVFLKKNSLKETCHPQGEWDENAEDMAIVTLLAEQQAKEIWWFCSWAIDHS
jgi:hypothetical protein